MLDPRDSDKDLADDIGFGLWKAKVKLPIETLPADRRQRGGAPEARGLEAQP